MKIFVIPGNPPIKHFYEMWMDELAQSLSASNVDTHIFPSIADRKESKEFLDEMTLFYENKIKQFSGNEEVIIIAHSIGGYFANQILIRNPQLIKKCMLVFPFLGKPNLKGKCILKFASILNTSKRAKKVLFKNIHYLEKLVPELRPSTLEELEICVRLAAHEAKTLGRQKDMPHISNELREKIHGFYCDGDDWFTKRAINQLGKQLKLTKIDTRHDFITDKFHRDLVTAKIKEALI